MSYYQYIVSKKRFLKGLPPAVQASSISVSILAFWAVLGANSAHSVVEKRLALAMRHQVMLVRRRRVMAMSWLQPLVRDAGFPRAGA